MAYIVSMGVHCYHSLLPVALRVGSLAIIRANLARCSRDPMAGNLDLCRKTSLKLSRSSTRFGILVKVISGKCFAVADMFLVYLQRA